MTLRKFLKNNFFIIFLLCFCFSNQIECDQNKFELIINNIQNYGSNINLVVGQDTINATQIISYENQVLTIDLLNEKWSNFSINQNFSDKKSTSIPFEIPISQIDCIIEVDRPNILKEYTYIGFIGLIFWGLLTIFQLI